MTKKVRGPVGGSAGAHGNRRGNPTSRTNHAGDRLSPTFEVPFPHHLLRNIIQSCPLITKLGAMRTICSIAAWKKLSDNSKPSSRRFDSTMQNGIWFLLVGTSSMLRHQDKEYLLLAASPQALKRRCIFRLNGTSELLPFPFVRNSGLVIASVNRCATQRQGHNYRLRLRMCRIFLIPCRTATTCRRGATGVTGRMP